jgi:hypothetical protein
MTTGEGGMLGIEGARISEPGSWTFGMWLGIERNPLVVTTEDMRTGALVEERVGGELGATFTATHAVSIGIRLPVVMMQDRASMVTGVTSDLAPLGGGLGDVAVTPKLVLATQEITGVDLAVAGTLTLPTGTARDYLREGFTFAPAVVVGRRGEHLRFAGELGYTLRPRTEVGGVAIDDEVYAKAGAAWRTGRTELGLTGSFATPTGGDHARYLELVGGPTVSVRTVDVFAAGGLGIDNGVGTPDWRMLAGIRYRAR